MKLLTHAIKLSSTVVISLALFTQAQALTPAQELLQIQKQWAEYVYQTEDKKVQYTLLQKLALKTNKLSTQYANNAELMTWDGIVLSTFAGIKGGMGGLSLAKEAKKKLERAKQIDDKTLNGSVYVSLGTLYSKVPGWPIGFGNSQKAKSYFNKALNINPNGIDPNYFYAEYLIDQNQQAKAISHLKKALNAPARPSRPVADKGRKQEALQLLAKLQ